jgi:hypothetical protein
MGPYVIEPFTQLGSVKHGDKSNGGNSLRGKDLLLHADWTNQICLPLSGASNERVV